ncbi:MAG TPA: HAMP domain-containing sensor histidine kinase [Candidatus Acidoferrales bacterium]
MAKITSRRGTIAFFVVLGCSLVALAVALNVGWIILSWREGVKLFFGVIFFAAIIAGMILNTIFLVREIRRNEQHDSFINAVTHELKTPITSIRLYLETMQRRDVGEAQRQQFFTLMLSDTDRLLGTVEQVLTAGESGYRRGKRHHLQLDFEALVRECIELARNRHHLETAAITFESAAAGHAVEVVADPDGLRTAVSNLLDNAIKYSGEKVEISVRLSTPDGLALLSVTDRGVGIPADELKRIFKRFYRVPGRNSFKIKGTGLGLFIVRAVAKAHGGKAYAASEGEGRGTTITLELPRKTA